MLVIELLRAFSWRDLGLCTLKYRQPALERADALNHGCLMQLQLPESGDKVGDQLSYA